MLPYSQSRSRKVSVRPRTADTPDPAPAPRVPHLRKSAGRWKKNQEQKSCNPFNTAYPFHVTAPETNRVTPSPCTIPARHPVPTEGKGLLRGNLCSAKHRLFKEKE